MRRVVIGLGALSLALLTVGCSLAAQRTVQQPEAASSGLASVGGTVDIDNGLQVKLVSVNETVPPNATESSPAPSPHWIQFEVTYTGDSAASLPSRPLQPTLIDGSGQLLDVQGSSVRLVNGGGSWGPAAAKLGGPYLNPGGSMVAWFEVPALDGAGNPIVIEYAPTRGKVARYRVP